MDEQNVAQATTDPPETTEERISPPERTGVAAEPVRAACVRCGYPGAGRLLVFALILPIFALVSAVKDLMAMDLRPATVALFALSALVLVAPPQGNRLVKAVYYVAVSVVVVTCAAALV